MAEMFENWEKPNWDDWFMAQAFVIAMRSIDTSTKVGCVVVDQNHRPLSVGYNGPPRGCDDSKIPMTRPEKYEIMEHGEANAIDNAAAKGISLEGSTFYVTGEPCVKCLRSMINVGAREIVYAPNQAVCIGDLDRRMKGIMLEGRDIVVRQIGRGYRDVLKQALLYDEMKNGRGE